MGRLVILEASYIYALSLPHAGLLASQNISSFRHYSEQSYISSDSVLLSIRIFTSFHQ